MNDMLPTKTSKWIRPLFFVLVLTLLAGCTTPVQPPVWNPN